MLFGIKSVYDEYVREKEKEKREYELNAPQRLEIKNIILDILNEKTDWVLKSSEDAHEYGYYRIVFRHKLDNAFLVIKYENVFQCSLIKSKDGKTIFEYYFEDDDVKNKIIDFVEFKNNRTNKLNNIINEL